MSLIYFFISFVFLVASAASQSDSGMKYAMFFAVVSVISELVEGIIGYLREKRAEINIQNDLNRIELERRKVGYHD